MKNFVLKFGLGVAVVLLLFLLPVCPVAAQKTVGVVTVADDENMPTASKFERENIKKDLSAEVWRKFGGVDSSEVVFLPLVCPENLVGRLLFSPKEAQKIMDGLSAVLVVRGYVRGSVGDYVRETAVSGGIGGGDKGRAGVRWSYLASGSGVWMEVNSDPVGTGLKNGSAFSFPQKVMPADREMLGRLPVWLQKIITEN